MTARRLVRAEGETEMTLEDVEKAVKRTLSDAEISAIGLLWQKLPTDRRKQKRLMHRAREQARPVELGLKAKK